MSYMLDTGLPAKSATWFSNFINATSKESLQSKVKLEVTFNKNLEEYNAHGTKSPYIEFDTQEDALAFVLRWM
jgi:hypothetical protein